MQKLRYSHAISFPFSLQKNYRHRPNYEELLDHPFGKRSATEEVDMAAYVTDILDNFQPAEGEES